MKKDDPRWSISLKKTSQHVRPLPKAPFPLSNELFEAIQNGLIKKGDPLQVAQIAGIMGAKKTSDIIPMCHPILLQGVDFTFEYQKNPSGHELIIQATVKCSGKTGVEMEALTAVINRSAHFL